MNTTRTWGVIGGLVLGLVQGNATADEAYLRDVKPLLKSKCFACHGALKQQAGLRLDTVDFMRTGGKNGSVIVAGKPSDSLMIQRITVADSKARMPKEAEPLSKTELAIIHRWIANGAIAPASETPEASPSDHWAFKRPAKPEIPASQHSKSSNPIDAFVATAHASEGLVARPPVNDAMLLRRVYVDLIGVPPSRDELHDFLNDKTPMAYRRVVDRLLNDPRHGERWGRHWMDVWRYSDWYGRRSQKDVRNSYPHIWRWRDWIVRSLNEDKGYDRMVTEMLAGDEVAPDDDATVVATGYLARSWFSLNTDEWMKDIVEHTGKAFLGLTLNCAHCHDHKYDPILQREYFAFRAFFEPLQMRHDRVPAGGALDKLIAYGQPGGPNPRKAIAAGLVRVFDEVLDAKTIFYTGGDARNKLTNQPPVQPAGPAIVGGDRLKIASLKLPPKAWYPGLREFAMNEDLHQHQSEITAARVAMDSVRGKPDDSLEYQIAAARLNAAQARMNSLRLRIEFEQAKHLHEQNPETPPVARSERRANHLTATVKVLEARKSITEADDKVKAAPDDKSRGKAEAELKKARQNLSSAEKAAASAKKALKDKGEKYTPLSPTYPAKSTGRRTALARWIVSPDNPLTARVAVNHIWARHFHEPIVEPVYDFGRNGNKPRFPRLLDWLAVELVESGWSMKHLHRLIVTSEVYRQDSRSFPDNHKNLVIDPDNHFLWRMNPHRMEAEVVRDSILHTAGQLDTAMGGPELPNAKADITNRRSVYFESFPEGSGKGDFVALFDAPDPCECYQRSESMLPQQALALMNSRLAINQSRLLATNIAGRVGENENDFIRYAFETVLSRPPVETEIQTCRSFLQEQVKLYSGKDLKSLVKKGYSNTVPASLEPKQRARESMVQALFSHHEFVNVP